jgi:hypothetical protein
MNTKLLSIIPANGWWALYDDDGAMIATPLAAWGLFRDLEDDGSDFLDGIEPGEGWVAAGQSGNIVGFYLSDEPPEQSELCGRRYVAIDGKPAAPDHWFEPFSRADIEQASTP